MSTHAWYIIDFTCKWNNLAVSGSVLRNNSIRIDIMSINDVHTHTHTIYIYIYIYINTHTHTHTHTIYIYIYTGHVANGQHLKSILKA